MYYIRTQYAHTIRALSILPQYSHLLLALAIRTQYSLSLEQKKILQYSNSKIKQKH